MQQLNFDSWYEKLENDYEDEKIQRNELYDNFEELDFVENSNLYEEYIGSVGNSEELESVC